MDDPPPIRRAALGCLAIAVVLILVALLVRPAIFTFSEPRDDSHVVLGTATEAAAGPALHVVLLSRAHGWDGERAADGRAEVDVIVAPITFGALAAVAAASPVTDDCPLAIGPDRLTDCDGRAWSFEGFPLDPEDPPLDRFPVRVDAGSVIVDLTRTVDD